MEKHPIQLLHVRLSQPFSRCLRHAADNATNLKSVQDVYQSANKSVYCLPVSKRKVFTSEIHVPKERETARSQGWNSCRFRQVYDPERNIPRTRDRLLDILTKLNTAGQLPDLPPIFGSQRKHTENTTLRHSDLNHTTAFFPKPLLDFHQERVQLSHSSSGIPDWRIILFSLLGL